MKVQQANMLQIRQSLHPPLPYPPRHAHLNEKIISFNFSMQAQPQAQVEVNSQSEDEQDHLFPRMGAKEFQQYLTTLSTSYQKGLHARQLANYCFRCHDALITTAYTQFKNLHHPELKEPSVSAFFGNECFLELQQVGVFLREQAAYPALHMAPVPKNLKVVLDEIFERNGYVPHLQRFLLFYPSYLEKHFLLEKELFSGDKLDSKVAYFLAFTAAAEMASLYTMVRYFHRFKAAGGDLRWINQGKYPPKYKAILELNRILAKAVWEISQDFMVELYQNSGYHWSQSEVALILEILIFSHQCSTIALAMGLNCEQPMGKLEILNIRSLQGIISDYRTKDYTPSENKEELAMAITHLKQEYEEDSKDSKEGKEGLTSLKKSMRRGQSEEEVEQYMKEIGQELSKQELAFKVNRTLKPLLDDHKLIEKRRENRYPTIDYSEYNLTFMAYPKLNSLTQNLADKILTLISYSETMTRDNFGSEKASNTKEFRRTMRYYAENLCGYRHHEFDYKTNTSLYLPLPLKFFIRLLTLSPVLINQHVIREIRHESGQVECFDIGHIVLLIANTRMNLELTLAMRAFEIE